MRLVTYRLGQAAARLGVEKDDLIVDVASFGERRGLPLPSSMLEFIDMGPAAVRQLQVALNACDEVTLVGCSFAASNAKLLAPIPRPRKTIFGIGLNYTEHVAESARTLDTSVELPTKPVIFSKPPTAVIANGEPILHNAEITQQLDWECELAVIIGSTARFVPKEDALKHVFGYTIVNDISARDCRRAGQWIVSKGMDSFAPMGPAIVTADEIPDPQSLGLKTWVNGVKKQDSNSKFMLFSVRDLIAEISSVMTLEPGDIIATGTPAGVGAGHDPQEWMWPGDVVECEVEKIGRLRNPVVKV